MKFTKFSLFYKWKNDIFGSKIFWSLYRNKHSILDGEKIVKFEILGKIFQKVSLFDVRKEKWEPKASKLFWQNFVK